MGRGRFEGNGRDKPKAGARKMQSLERASVNYTTKKIKILLMNRNLHPCARIVPASTLSVMVNIHCFIDLFILVLNIGCMLTIYIIGHGWVLVESACCSVKNKRTTRRMEIEGAKNSKTCQCCKTSYDPSSNTSSSCRIHPSFFVSRRHDDQKVFELPSLHI